MASVDEMDDVLLDSSCKKIVLYFPINLSLGEPGLPGGEDEHCCRDDIPVHPRPQSRRNNVEEILGTFPVHTCEVVSRAERRTSWSQVQQERFLRTMPVLLIDVGWREDLDDELAPSC